MIKFILLIIRTFILLFVFTAYASGFNADNSSEQFEQIKISLPPEEKIGTPEIISDYNSNEIAIKAVNKHINLFTEKIREKFSLWLSRSGKYIELMKNILKKENIPEEIVFIPLIESGFSPNACSPARAVGYWQFIASTARKYGLKINWWMDERRDPIKSTVAAANYFKDLYKMFGSWNLAMAAYNAGEGKVLKALNMTKTEDYWSLLNTKYLRNETKDYVPKFIAASMIANSPKEFGFDDIEYHPPFDYDEVTLDYPIDLDVAADCADTDLKTIKELNPELTRWCTPPDVSEYTLRIPAGTKDIFLKNLSMIPEKERFSIEIYYIKKGDTLKKISRKTRIPLRVIIDLNSMEKLIPLKAGSAIFIPPKEKFVIDNFEKMYVKKASYKVKKKTIMKKRGSNKRIKNRGIKKVSIKYKMKNNRHSSQKT
ncbi:MAG: transglycosylase SLT domain-containing protein [Nitrospirae bacterium]|nr:transglycosylase SLT domain-containing protein [Nitrospirota bacterium]